jgi:hypothetical protein
MRPKYCGAANSDQFMAHLSEIGRVAPADIIGGLLAAVDPGRIEAKVCEIKSVAAEPGDNACDDTAACRRSGDPIQWRTD